MCRHVGLGFVHRVALSFSIKVSYCVKKGIGYRGPQARSNSQKKVHHTVLLVLLVYYIRNV